MVFKKNLAVTLIEIIIVVVIVGILAALALPRFQGMKEHAFGKEAQAALKLIAAAERIYNMEIGGYFPAPNQTADASAINQYLRLSLTETNWDYSVTSTATTNWAATADRMGAGGYLDCSYTFGSSASGDEPVGSGSCP